MSAMLDPRSLTVVVTGATSGIGEATVRRFAAAGALVVVMGRRKDRLQALRDELGEHILPVELDVRDAAATEAAFASLPAPFADYNVVFANAGLALGLEPAQQASLSNWDTMVETNINGMLYTVRASLPAMVARKQGHVVLTGSIAGEFPYPGANVYGATKAFVKQFSLNLWADVAGTGVRVTNIEPGLVETEFSMVRFEGDAGRARKVYAGAEPMTGADIAEQVFFACTLPRHVNINRIQAMPSRQTFGNMTVRRD
ncbi:SDR family NAD(P)-dependent oxidoreductase [Xanthobacter pseudotagetidis]|uniref:SDR family NAD(P)-dependent oxidoreductase n=1 Tax=Xanthobacter pseudotagetidis TaxID=3119911 RepID=UPI0037294780